MIFFLDVRQIRLGGRRCNPLRIRRAGLQTGWSGMEELCLVNIIQVDLHDHEFDLKHWRINIRQSVVKQVCLNYILFVKNILSCLQTKLASPAGNANHDLLCASGPRRRLLLSADSDHRLGRQLPLHEGRNLRPRRLPHQGGQHFKIWPIPATFCLFSFFSNFNSNTVWKSLDVVLGIQTQDGIDGSTELWRPPRCPSRGRNVLTGL